ncbi:protein lava lamp-like [Echeneis naucrates]|uniref:protein lava lamp-like n=1 Tax=Echeneis naucrates TaxID=173247 RepID=UPI001113724B|nr:protein lava lamp-like [Echeneis naucrates]
MQHSHRLDQRVFREEVKTMTQEKERGEQIWRERLQRCQRQLRAKEEEMSRQSQYFENFKTQLQHKLSLARDREQILQKRIYTLEKQLLDMTVNAATGMKTISEVRITAGTVNHWLEEERLTSLRGECEGEEEKKEERRKQLQPSVGIGREGKQKGDKGKAEEQIEGGRNKDLQQSSNEARLQGFILSLQEDLRVLLEREEGRLTEQRGLMEQLQEAQENRVFMGCKVEELKAEVQQLKLSESSLMLEVEELRETENLRLQQILRDGANQTSTQPSTVWESTCPSPGISLPSCSPVTCPDSFNNELYTTAMGDSVGSLGEVCKT